MLSSEFDLVLPGCTLEQVRSRAARHEDGRFRGLWVRIEPGDRITARSNSGGRLPGDGTLVGHAVRRGADVVVSGRMRWRSLQWIVLLYAMTAAAVLTMGIVYRNGVVLLVAGVPLVMATLYARSLVVGRGVDIRLLQRRLFNALGVDGR